MKTSKKVATVRKQDTEPHQYTDDAIAVILVLVALYGYYFLGKEAPEWLIALLALVGTWAFGKGAIAAAKKYVLNR